MEAIGKFLVSLALFVFNIFVGGFTLFLLWHWFIVPLGIMKIGVAQAIGLDIVVSFFTYPIMKLLYASNEDEANIVSSTGRTLEGAIVLLSIGFIVHLFI